VSAIDNPHAALIAAASCADWTAAAQEHRQARTKKIAISVCDITGHSRERQCSAHFFEEMLGINPTTSLSDCHRARMRANTRAELECMLGHNILANYTSSITTATTTRRSRNVGDTKTGARLI